MSASRLDLTFPPGFGTGKLTPLPSYDLTNVRAGIHSGPAGERRCSRTTCSTSRPTGEHDGAHADERLVQPGDHQSAAHGRRGSVD